MLWGQTDERPQQHLTALFPSAGAWWGTLPALVVVSTAAVLLRACCEGLPPPPTPPPRMHGSRKPPDNCGALWLTLNLVNLTQFNPTYEICVARSIS
ncbi:hypothetical protein O3P69_019620 [Scylla paramamosain]|uniref:Uncharacterized protein n=1 Tax=Scylla paramamosain TaxID=85552 RepID=A0AAW0SXN7_SCYPA